MGGTKQATTQSKKPVMANEEINLSAAVETAPNPATLNSGVAYTDYPERIANLYKRFANPSRLSSEGKDYIDRIKVALRETSVGNTIQSELISIGELDAVIYTIPAKNVGILLMFHETMVNQNEVPSYKISKLMEQYKINSHPGKSTAQLAAIEEVKLLTSITIIPEEYNPAYAVKMANAIANGFVAYDVAQEDSFNILTIGDSTIMVVTNPQQVRDYITQHSPHAVPERNDIGFLVRSATRTRNNDIIPGDVMFAVSGYTKFVTPKEAQTASNKIRPVPTISAIVSRAPLVGYLPFAIAIATDCFCTKGMWREPYRNLAKGRPNLGYLIDQPDGTHRSITTAAEFDAVIQNNFDMPMLAIDISEGRYSFPGMLSFATDPKTLYASIEKFFNKNAHYKKQDVDLSGPGSIVMEPAISYNTLNGIVVDKSGPSDTRWVDFLMLAMTFEDYNAISAFMYQPIDPAARINQIRQHYTDTKLLYNTKTLVFSPETLAYLFSSKLQPAGIDFYTDYNNNTGNYNMASQLDAIAAAWQREKFILSNRSVNSPNGVSGVNRYF